MYYLQVVFTTSAIIFHFGRLFIFGGGYSSSGYLFESLYCTQFKSLQQRCNDIFPTTLFMYTLHTIWFTYFKYSIQWFLVTLPRCAAITTTGFQLFP